MESSGSVTPDLEGTVCTPEQGMLVEDVGHAQAPPGSGNERHRQPALPSRSSRCLVNAITAFLTQPRYRTFVPLRTLRIRVPIQIQTPERQREKGAVNATPLPLTSRGGMTPTPSPRLIQTAPARGDTPPTPLVVSRSGMDPVRAAAGTPTPRPCTGNGADARHPSRRTMHNFPSQPAGVPPPPSPVH